MLRALLAAHLLVAVIFLGQPAYAAKSQISSIEFLFTDNTVASPNQIGTEEWKPFEAGGNQLKPQQNKSLWIRFTINHSSANPAPTLGFDKIFTRYQFFRENKLISSFGTESGYAGLPPHLIELPRATGNISYYLKTDSDVSRIGPVGRIRLGHKSDFILDYFQKDGVKLVVISCLGLLTLAGFVLFALYSTVTTYLYLALFSLCGLLYLAAGLQSRVILGMNPVLLGNAGYLGLYFAPYFFVEFYRRIFSISIFPAHITFLRAISLGFPILATAISFFLPSGFLSVLTLFYVIAIPVFIGVLLHSITSLRSHAYAKTFYAGFTILFLTGLWEAANEVRIINSHIKTLPIGLLAFYLALTTMQGQFFAQLFRTAKLNAQNEAIAKQRLQRVLECTNILAQSRNYKSLFEAVSKNISSELKIAGEAYSIDFLFSDIKASIDESATESLHHFTYQVVNPDEPGTLHEVLQRGESTLGEQQADKLTSLPGVFAAGVHDSMGGPSTTLTVPIDFGVFYGAVVVRKYGSNTFSISEREEFISFINSIAASLLISLKNIDYISDVKKKAIIDSQMDAARAQQFALLPTAPNIENISFVSFNRSAGKTGGDWHDCFFDEVNQRLFITIGDVTGHDFASSIITGVAAGAVRAWKENSSNTSSSAEVALEEIARLTNRVICTSSQGLKFMTMIFMCLEIKTGKLHLINAGHPHPFHLSCQHKPSTVPVSGHILGQSPDHSYHAESFQLQDNDRIFLYTDGLFDNESQQGEKIKRRSFVNFWQDVDNYENKFEEFVSTVNQAWKDTELEDDVTLVMLGWRRPNEHQNTAA